jgi:hypothetical protein
MGSQYFLYSLTPKVSLASLSEIAQYLANDS